MIKFLIIRFSSIGDIVLTTPVMRCIKEQVEDAEVHVLTKPQNEFFLVSNPHIEQIHILEKSFKTTVEKLKYQHFDYIIDLHRNIRSLRVKNALGLPSFSFDKINKEKFLLVNFKINRLPKNHIVDRYLATTSVFDVKNDNKGLDYFIPEKDKVNKISLPEAFRNGYVGLVIGAQHATKRLNLDQLCQLANNLKLPTIVLGGPEDSETGEKMQSCNPELIYNAAGKFNLNQSSSLVEQAKVVISHDTGLMHIAAAFKKKIVSVWGNTISEFGMYPYLAHKDSTQFEVKGLKCRPCSKIGFIKCPKKHFKCMLDQNLNEIIAKTQELY